MSVAALLLLTAMLPQGMQALIDARGLTAFDEADELEIVATRADGTAMKLVPGAAAAWRAMHEAAAADGIELIVVSAFRSITYQHGIIQRKLDAGQTPEQILAVSAPPGYSEHHSGRALDLTTPGSPVLEEAFADTDAFRWLQKHAGRYGFVLSYPPGNPHGFTYEPWHWAWHRGQNKVPDS
ncbi:MAG: M15 family metallopeptidase [Gammaproteobacteria bacterium]